MRPSVALLTLGLIAVLASAALAQANVIPRYTVIPVTMDDGLNSAVSNVGDLFYSHCVQANCGGFPTGTRFMGRVTSVVRASGSTPGQIDVRFVQAILPDGRNIPINGLLSSLNSSAVTTNPRTGQMTARVERRNDRNRFIYYGAGAGVLIGALTRGNVLTGGLLGAAAGWLAGALTRGGSARNVDIPPGTEFGIMLNSSVTIPPRSGAGPGTQPCPPCPPSGEGPDGGWNVVLRGPQPFMTNAGVWMLPLRDVMLGVGRPFTMAQRTITLNTERGIITHTTGTRVVYDDGAAIQLSAPSRTVGNVLYVPLDFVSVALGRTATWFPDTRTLEIR